MPPLLYPLTVLAPDRIVFRGRVQSLVAPGAEGSFGVLANHAPMVAELTIGELRAVNEAGEVLSFAVSGGLLEVTWQGVTVFADAAEAAEEIDVERARAAAARAEQRLASRSQDWDLERLHAALRRAVNRLRVAERARRQSSHTSHHPSTKGST